jgi:hypothetical protein
LPAGNPEARFEALLGSEREGRLVAALLGVEPWTGADVLKSRLTAARSPFVLHIATHGFFDDAKNEHAERWGRG